MKPAVLLLFMFPLLLSAQTGLEWLEGTWTGVGYQAPTDSKWEIVLTSKEGQINIQYPSLSCGGHWKLIESREGYAEFTEVISTGIENCDNNVKVVLNRIDEEYISIAYFLPQYYDGVIAYSVLRKSANTEKKKIPLPKGDGKRT